MVLGLRSKNRKGGLVQINYLINIREIKPWPPSQSLASAQSVLIQWENGDKASGFFASNAADGKVEFGEFFRLPVTLSRETSKKGNGGDLFQKNYLEFNLYEPRKDKTTKGQLLGSAVINLAEYGIVKDVITISTPISFKKSSKGSAQSVLYVSVRPFDGDTSSLSKEVSLDGSESVSEITNEGNDEETEIASFTDGEDDDNSSNSSRNIGPSALESNKVASNQYDKNESESGKSGMGRVKEKPATPSNAAASRSVIESAPAAIKHQNGDLYPPSLKNVSSNLQNPTHEHIPRVVSSDDSIQLNTNPNYVDRGESQTSKQLVGKSWRHNKNGLHGPTGSLDDGLVKDHEEKERQEHGLNGEVPEVKKHVSEEKSIGKFPEDARTNQVKLRSNTLANNRAATAVQGNTRKDMLKHLKSVQLQFDSTENDECFIDGHFMEKPRKIDIAKNVLKGSDGDTPSGRKHRTESPGDNKVKLKSKIELLEEGISEVASAKVDLRSTVGNHEKFTKNTEEMKRKKKKENDLQENACKDGGNYPSSERQGEAFNDSGDKVELKTKVEMLEEELMEAAALEIGLYSVVAEHGSSTNKVHAPARRLARFYLHACKANSPAQRASAARAIISGLVLVSKACGNDVPRLSFWLSNTIMLRVIVSQAVNGNDSPKNRHNSSPCKEKRARKTEDSDEWEDPQTYIVALEKVEAWNFSRIVESIWWQTLTPHMQSTAVKGSTSRKTHAKKYGLGNAEQGNFAVDLWKKAFKDACERLCPIRAGGHECGCLAVLAKLVMEQLVGRLDVAMFNAILRESAEDMPTDPVSDPISDPKVLPIPAGKSGFGAGAQLKNAVGNWSRWLTDLFGIDDSDSPEENDENDGNRPDSQTSFKAFHLLKALSDLMMLPFEMLADRSTRKEVCPTFDGPLIKRVLNNFVPDEFSPDHIPESIFEALDSEDNAVVRDDSVSSFPLTAAPATYSPPAAASLINIIGDVGTQHLQRSGSAVIRKSYTSDDELDELDSPMASIFPDNNRNSPVSTPNWMLKGKGGRKVVRYQLLRQVWKNGE